MEDNSFARVWQDVFTVQPEPPLWLVITTGVIALLVVATGGRAWRIARNVVTIAHEGGHALAALLSGRQLAGVRLHSDTSGVTVSRGRPDGIGMIVTILAGYTAPAVVGLVGIVLLTAGRITGLLWISILLLAMMLLLIRNVYGVVSVVGTGAVVFLVSWFTPAQVQSFFAYLFTWFMLFASVRPVFELQSQRRRQPSPHSDADQLDRLTGVPGTVWVMFFGLFNIAVVVLGVWLLLFR
ncbi:M50 family metallopeptidase [Thermobifida cellulosilytica]|uniref:Membrane protein n=1 Tax=Thermobifida cellulosilytica TB100 TaxID=665004 RepID=A0A147KGA0_THECS|nr:M50 family metallopeptidase [Thermobifida cellulosilytica]KUP96344.1 membrane protein [Thermobifida cellulosilytica TB100]